MSTTGKLKEFDSSTFNKRQFSLYKKRLYSKSNLIWTKQVFELIKNFNITKINDLGCNYFQFYKEIKSKKFSNYDYFGYDIDENYIKLGLSKFPELKNKYKIGDIQKLNLRRADCTIISATLEHVFNPSKLLESIFKSTKKIIILRTFLGEKMQKKIQKRYNKKPFKNLKKEYHINQFAFSDIENAFKKNDFSTFYRLDKATHDSSKFLLVNNRYKRYMYIVLGIKNNLI